MKVHRWGVGEISLKSSKNYNDPVRDVDLGVVFVSPAGKKLTRRAVWDGEHRWLARVEASEAGRWKWSSHCSDEGDSGLNEQGGEFDVAEYSGTNPVYLHGPLTVSADGRRFAHADGTPFFWMFDTAWNGVMKSSPEDWNFYLKLRRSQGFTGIQSVMTQWRAFVEDREGETAFSGTEAISINPRFFARLDEKVAAVNRQGLFAALVLLWACTPKDPGYYLPEEDALILARYIKCRYDAFQVVWFLGGDGDYLGETAERWKRLGQRIFGSDRDRLVTMHPKGMHWLGNEFRKEEWYDFVGYQSGHMWSEERFHWLTWGPAATGWDVSPVKPVIDLEPRYDHHRHVGTQQYYSAQEVRNGLYWNLLNTPAVGVTYGSNGVWPWNEKREVPMDHPDAGEAPPWFEAVCSEGGESVKYLRRFFDIVGWHHLFPAQEVLAVQPGAEEPLSHIAVARCKKTGDLVVYLPKQGTVELKADALEGLASYRWYRPSEGCFYAKRPIEVDSSMFEAPGSGDWLLWMQSA